MKIKRITALYFSPCGSTEKTVRRISSGILKSIVENAPELYRVCGGDEIVNGDNKSEIDGIEYVEISWTAPAERSETLEFSEGDLLICGSPTYAGKLPNKILPDFQTKLQGNGAMAVGIVTYGNRSFDNSLAEMCFTLENNGFRTIAAAAFTAQHAFTDELAQGRPDASDMKEMDDFAEAAAKKLAVYAENDERTLENDAEAEGEDADSASFKSLNVKGDAAAPYYTPLGTDGLPAKFLKAVPKTDGELCGNCGLCASRCPMGSISAADCSEVTGICIKCHACVNNCPAGAKYFDDAAFLSHRQMLIENYRRRAENYVCV